MVMRMMGDSLGVSGVEGDTKLSSRLGSAARAVAAAAGGEPQLAVTKDSLPPSLAQWQSVSLITEQISPLQPLHISTSSFLPRARTFQFYILAQSQFVSALLVFG